MPSNEQIIEYVKNKIRKDVETWLSESVDLMLFPLRKEERGRVMFGKTKVIPDHYDLKQSDFKSIDEVKIIATTMPSRYKRATVVDLPEVKVDSEYDAGFADGKASLKPFDRDELERVLYVQGGMAKARALEISSLIAEHFAAPKPKPWACTEEQAGLVKKNLIENRKTDMFAPIAAFTWKEFRNAINAVLSLELESQSKPKPFTQGHARAVIEFLIREYEGDLELRNALKGVHFDHFANAVNHTLDFETKYDDMKEAIEHVLNEEQGA